MEKEASKFIEYILSILKKAEDFALDQASQFIQEFLNYWMVIHSM